MASAQRAVRRTGRSWWKLAPGAEGGLRDAVVGLEPSGGSSHDDLAATLVLAGVLGASGLLGFIAADARSETRSP